MTSTSSVPSWPKPHAAVGVGLSDFKILRRVLRMALRYRRGMAIAVGTTVLAAVFQLLIPQYLGRAVDSAQGLLGSGEEAAARAALWQAAALLLGASVLRGLFTMWHNYQGEAVGQRIAYDLRMAYYAQLQRLSFGFHDRVHTGELITRGMLDIEGIRMVINAGMIRLVLITILVGVGATLLLSREPLLGLIALGFVPFAAWRSVVARLRLRASWLALQEKLGVLTRVMEENLGGIRVVRAFAAQPHELAKFDAVSDEALELADRRIDLRVRNTAAMTYAFFLAMGLLLWVGGHKVLAGEITVGTLAEYLAFMAILQMPVRQLGMMVNAFARASMSGERLFEVLDREPEIIDRPGARDLVVSDAVLRFENVVLRLSRRGARAADAARHQLRGARRPDARDRRPAGQRQVDHRPSDPALLRRRRRPDHDRRPGRAGRHPGVAAPDREPGPAGHVPVHRLDREQHRLRRSLGRARAHRPVERDGTAARLYRRAAEGLRDPGRRARRVALGRPAPAPVDRPQHPAQPADPGVRRLRLRRSMPRPSRASARRFGRRPRAGRRSSSRTGSARSWTPTRSSSWSGGASSSAARTRSS